MSETVLCKDCKHAKWKPFKLYTWYCHREIVPEKIEENFVTGHKVTPAHYPSCSIERLSHSPCGKDGKFWTPKNKKDLFKLIKHVSI